MTRLLNTAIIGVTAMRVASSCIDMLAGLLPIGMRKTPPGFCAKPMPPIRHIASANAATAHVRPTRRIGPLRLCRLILLSLAPRSEVQTGGVDLLQPLPTMTFLTACQRWVRIPPDPAVPGGRPE